MQWNPLPYQERAVRFLLERGAGGLFLNPGRGKTSIVLATHQLLREHKQIKRTLVIAPINPMYAAWPAEIKKWDDFRDIGVEILHGPKKDERLDALDRHKSMYVMNFEGLKWLAGRVSTMDDFPFDMLVIDESSFLKDTSTQRWKLLKPMLKLFRRRYILTGDPAPNSLLELWGQAYAMDLGASLGPYVSHFRTKYFTPHGYGGYDWQLQPDGEERIRAALAPRVYTLTEEDQEGLPPITYNTVLFEMTEPTMKKYRELKRKLRLEFPDGSAITAVNMGVLTNKLQQFTGGAVYTGEDEYEIVHDEKIEALRELINERQGRPTVVVYRFRHELEQIRKALGKDLPSFADGEKVLELQARWNRGEIPVLLAQEQSMSHGLNMQEVEAHVIWFYITASNERYRQLIRRIYRTGQKHPVVVHHLVAAGTWDERGLALVQGKDRRQQSFLSAVRAYWNEELKEAVNVGNRKARKISQPNAQLA